jgi:hypothetical protein
MVMASTPRFIQLVVPLPLLKLMDQSRYGVIRVMEEAQAHPLIVATLRFIQLQEPLLPLKLMDQSRHGVTRVLEVKAHLLMASIPRFIPIVAIWPPVLAMLGVGTGAPT